VSTSELRFEANLELASADPQRVVGRKSLIACEVTSKSNQARLVGSIEPVAPGELEPPEESVKRIDLVGWAKDVQVDAWTPCRRHVEAKFDVRKQRCDRGPNAPVVCVLGPSERGRRPVVGHSDNLDRRLPRSQPREGIVERDSAELIIEEGARQVHVRIPTPPYRSSLQVLRIGHARRHLSRPF